MSYRSVDVAAVGAEDVEQRGGATTVNDNNVGEAHLHRAAGLRGASSSSSTTTTKTLFVAAIGAMAVLGFGATVTSSSRDGMRGNSVSSAFPSFRLGSRRHRSSNRLGDGTDGAPICAQDLHMIEEKLNDATNADDPMKAAIQNDFPNVGAFPSIDPHWERDTNSWHHTPAFSGNSGEDGFVMCLPGEWDDSYTYNFNSMFQEGMCIKKVRTDIVNGDFSGCDVRVFNQAAYIFNNDFKQGNITSRAEDNVFHPPPKLSPDVVDFYYAHESPDHYGYELRGDTEYSKKSLGNMEYLAWFNGDPHSPLQSSIWYPFGPSIGSIMRDYTFFTKSIEERIPVVAWMSKDCVQRHRINLLVALSKHFPVFSMGRCEQNIAPPPGDVGRLGDFEAQQEMKSNYMFYFALENGVQCPHYMTEKIYDALTRGSIPIYIGWDGFEEYIPSKDAVIDLRDYESIDHLAAKLAKIATSESEYAKYHAWRHKSPTEWPLKFRNLVRQVSSDLKFGICSTLKQGPSKHPRVEPFEQATDVCNHNVNIMGIPASQYPGRLAEWWEILGWKADTAGEVAKVEVEDPTQFLQKKCDEMHHAECWELNMPNLVSYARAVYPDEEEDSENESEEESGDEEQEVQKAHESFVDVMEDIVGEVEDAFDGDDDDDDDDDDNNNNNNNNNKNDEVSSSLSASDDSRASTSNERSSDHHNKHYDEEEGEEEEGENDGNDDDENEGRSVVKTNGEEVTGMLDNPATTPSDLLLLRKELELLEKENALLKVKEKAAQLGIVDDE